MRHRARLQLRLPEATHDLVMAAARRLDMSASELVRRAVVAAAVEVLRGGPAPPPTDPTPSSRAA
jgi:uncharacterized protein (DUF1778 family)